tara:strand:- start:640 stop:1512 length:873 start_codon:yes stop_codon:yes gene_type:complete
MRQSKKYKQSEWLVEGPEEMAKLKADQAREAEDLKRRHEGEVEALKMKHERESERQGKKDEAEAEREAQSESLEEGKLVADDLMIIKGVANSLAKEMENRVKKNRESGVNFINQLIRSAGMKKTVSAKGQRGGHLFLRQGDNISEAKLDVTVDPNNDIPTTAPRQKAAFKIVAIAKKEYGLKAVAMDNHVRLQGNKRDIDNFQKDQRSISKKVKMHIDNHDKTTPQIDKMLNKSLKNFKEEGLKEKLDKNSDAGDYVKDFRKSDAPQFKGKSDKKIRQMAIAAYLDNKKG